MVLARAAHGWSKWRNEAERNGDFARSPEVDMLAIAAENALAAIARLSAVNPNSPSTTARLSIDANDLVAPCASCKQVRAEDGSWTSIGHVGRSGVTVPVWGRGRVPATAGSRLVGSSTNR
jgi:hypothetical protein